MHKRIQTVVGLLALTILFIFSAADHQQAYASEILADWSGSLSLGYNNTSGNTEKSSLNVSGQVKKMLDEAEFLLKGDIYTASTNNNTDAQTWTALTRYAYDFGTDNRWFNSYQITADHDRFADIDYRITPTTGIGYWFFNDDDFKLNLEGSLGYEMTEYRSNRSADKTAVFVLHSYAEKQIFERAKLSEDISIIPALSDDGTRIKSTTELTNPITDSIDISVKYILDHDTEPSAGKKKTDTKLVTGLKYSF